LVFILSLSVALVPAGNENERPPREKVRRAVDGRSRIF
jgi:hypothetical protein